MPAARPSSIIANASLHGIAAGHTLEFGVDQVVTLTERGGDAELTAARGATAG